MWSRIEPLMPADPVRGRRWAEHRHTLEAIAWKYRTCSPWRDLPGELGPFQTAHERLPRWAVDGTWTRMPAAVSTAADADDDLNWTVSADSTVMRAHQHTCDDARSVQSSRSRPTRSETASGGATRAGARPASTPMRTSSASPSSAASTDPSSGGGLAIQCDKLGIAYQAALHLAAIVIWARR